MFYFGCEYSPKLGVHQEILQAEGFQRSRQLSHTRKENLLYRKISRADKEMLLALKYK